MKNRIIFAEAGDGSGTGGTQPTGTLLGGGSKPGATDGGANPGNGNPPNGGTIPNQTPNQNTEIKFPENWKMGLPKDLQEDSTLKLINDVPSLAKSYVNAQKMIGADKIVVPSKHATDEDWKGVFSKLGLPSDLKEYGIKKPDGSDLEDDFLEQFKAEAHKSNILPKQAQKLVDWFSSANKVMTENVKKEMATKQIQAIEGLKKEWGLAFEGNVNKAHQVLKSFADEGMMQYIEKSGLGNDVNLIKLFAKIGESLQEDKIIGKGSGTPMFTPDSARSEINKIMGDFNHPYHISSHPNHGNAVEEMKKLFAQAYPS